MSKPPDATGDSLIAEYETAEGRAQILGLNGGFTVVMGERMVQKDLGAREIACYLAHVLQAVHYRLSKVTQDRDARAREACTAEGRQGCSFARSEIPRIVAAEMTEEEIKALFVLRPGPITFVPSVNEKMREALAWIASQERYTFAECSLAEEIIGRARNALDDAVPSATRLTWNPVSENAVHSVRGVAWIDDQATHVGRFKDGKRYLLELPK